MKKYFVKFIVGLLFTIGLITSGCSYDEKREIENIIVEETDGIEEFSDKDIVEEDDNIEEFSDRDIIEKVYNELVVDRIEHCSDGSEIIVFRYTGDINNYELFFVRYIPNYSKGRYNFFEEFYAMESINLINNNDFEIPIALDKSEKYRFSIRFNYSIENGEIIISNEEVVFLNEEDKAFNDLFSSMEYSERDEYRKSFIFNEELSTEKQIEFLKACINNGNIDLFEKLSKLQVDDKIMLASYNNGIGTLDKDNDYISRIFYQESIDEFIYNDIVKEIATNVQLGLGNTVYGENIIEVEPNFDSEMFDDIPNIKDYVMSVGGDISFNKYHDSYRYDLDNDGLDEILLYSIEGSGLFVYWYILHLDANGEITACNSSNKSYNYDLKLYRMDNRYFFSTVDRNNVIMIGKDNKIYEAEIYNNFRYATKVLDISFNNIFEFNPRMDEKYIDNYKDYGNVPIGNSIEDDAEISEIGVGHNRGVYGKIDINNDGIDDYTYFFMDEHYKYGYYYDFKIVDGKTKELIDFKNSNLKYGRGTTIAFVYKDEGKNYLVNMIEAGDNYLFKTYEINGTKAVQVAGSVYSKVNDIMITIDIYERESKIYMDV